LLAAEFALVGSVLECWAFHFVFQVNWCRDILANTLMRSCSCQNIKYKF